MIGELINWIEHGNEELRKLGVYMKSREMPTDPTMDMLLAHIVHVTYTTSRPVSRRWRPHEIILTPFGIMLYSDWLNYWRSHKWFSYLCLEV